MCAGLGVLVAVGCGGGGGSGSTTTLGSSAPTTAVTVPSTTATTAAPRIPVPVAEPVVVALAQRGLLTAADFGGDWVEARAGGGVLRDIGPTSRIGCALQPTGLLPPPSVTAVLDGPVVQKGASKRYATSSVLGFADEAGAQAAADAFRSPGWSTCRAAAKTREARAQPAGAVDPQWKAELEDTGRGQGGYEGVIRFQYQAVVDGQLIDANGYETVLLYRVGRTVLLVTAEGLDDPADPPNLGEAVSEATNRAAAAAVKRLAG